MADTYAIGDLHGEVTLLRQLLDVLPLRSEDTLVFLGDYLDRGEDSVATILALQALQQTHANCIFLRGNHEDAWLDRWDGSSFSYPPSIDGAAQVWERCDRLTLNNIGHWLETTTLIEYEDEYAYYVHAGVSPGKPFWRTPTFHKMWGVRGFLESNYNWGKPIVFGHWQLAEPLIEANKMGVDTGAYKTGVLSAIRLPERQIIQARRP